MKKFPELLRATAVDWKKARKPILISMLVVGCISIAVTMILWQTAVTSGRETLSTLLGPEKTAQIEQQIFSSAQKTIAVEDVIRNALADIDATMTGLTDEQKADKIGMLMGSFFVDVMPVLIGFVVLSIILHLWTQAFNLALAKNLRGSFGKLAGEAIAWMLPLLGVNLLLSLAFAGWVFLCALMGGVLSLAIGNTAFILAAVLLIAGFVAYAPRFALANAILIPDRTGVVESLRRSYRMTAGRWGKVVGNFIGVTALVWITLFIVQFILHLIGRVLPFPGADLLVGQFLVFAQLLCSAFAVIFAVRLKEALGTAKAPKA